MAALADSAGVQVPEDVLRLLRDAYGTNSVGKTGYELAGHTVEQRAKLEGSAGDAVASLQYGELLPEGVAKAFHRLGLCGTAPSAAAQETARSTHVPAAGTLLELGMGTGMVAMQAFLQCDCLRGVVGIEVSEARCAVGVAALARLAAAAPDRYSMERLADSSSPGCDTQEVKSRCCILQKLDSQCLQLQETTPGDASIERGTELGNDAARETHTLSQNGYRRLEFLEGDLGQLPPEFAREATAIFLQVVLPECARKSAHQLLQHAPDGCRAFLLEDLRETWLLEEPSIFHALEDDSPAGVDRYACSWNPAGHRFYVFEADRTRRASITLDSAAWKLAVAEAEGHEL